MAEPKPWFRTRHAGWRWGAPLTWQGWLAYGVYGAVVLTTGHFFQPRQVPVQFIGVALVATAAFLGVIRALGDKPGPR
jgi:hypothetical protein